MKIYDTHCPTQGVTPEKVLNPVSARTEDPRGAGSAGSPQHGLRAGQPSDSHPGPKTGLEGQFLGLLSWRCVQESARGHAAAGR